MEKKLIIDERNTAKVNFESGQIEYFNENLFSSGEKQVVSIFYYLIFSGKEYFIIIDEPELSVSAFWQEKLLPDILSHKPLGILVATHSPYIFKNNLRAYTYSFENFREVEV